MPPTFSRQNLSDTILGAMQRSVPKYRDMTGMDVFRAPESFFSVAIADEIHRKLTSKKGFVALEQLAGSILRDANARTRGPLQKRMRRGKYDLVVFYDNGNPRAVVEVKTNVYKYAMVSPDIERLSNTVKKNIDRSTLQVGVFVYFCAAWAETKKSEATGENELKRVKRIEESVRKHLSKRKFKDLDVLFDHRHIKNRRKDNLSVVAGIVSIWRKPRGRRAIQSK